MCKDSVLLLIKILNNMKSTHFIASLLLWIGGINWGLVGLSGFFDGNWNLVEWLFSSWPMASWIVYILVGVSAVYLALTHKGSCKDCQKNCGVSESATDGMDQSM